MQEVIDIENIPWMFSKSQMFFLLLKASDPWVVYESYFSTRTTFPKQLQTAGLWEGCPSRIEVVALLNMTFLNFLTTKELSISLVISPTLKNLSQVSTCFSGFKSFSKSTSQCGCRDPPGAALVLPWLPEKLLLSHKMIQFPIPSLLPSHTHWKPERRVLEGSSH